LQDVVRAGLVPACRQTGLPFIFAGLMSEYAGINKGQPQGIAPAHLFAGLIM